MTVIIKLFLSESLQGRILIRRELSEFVADRKRQLQTELLTKQEFAQLFSLGKKEVIFFDITSFSYIQSHMILVHILI